MDKRNKNVDHTHTHTYTHKKHTHARANAHMNPQKYQDRCDTEKNKMLLSVLKTKNINYKVINYRV